MSYEYVEDEPWRRYWRIGFATLLVLALVVGLALSLRPDRTPDAILAEDGRTGATEASSSPEAEAVEAGEEAGDGAETDGEDDAEEEDTSAEDEAAAQELIDAARDPEETTVQVLDGGGGSSATNDAAAVLRDLGYDVVAINSSRTDVSTTAVLYTEGNEAEAEAMRARDERFADIAVNDRLSEGVDLHVIVADDWG